MVIEHLLRHTALIESGGPARWLPSLLVRRLDELPLTLRSLP
ncbi:hypothetical protein [Mycobacterium sp. SMC-8]|nr:hypothetical protein [Mycobacterium sp. SMC-8]